MSTNISLTPELEQYTKDKVKEGFYSSTSELMREALRLLRKKDLEYAHKLKLELLHAEEDIKQNRIEPLDIRRLLNEFEKE